jgi:hypothetical protein
MALAALAFLGFPGEPDWPPAKWVPLAIDQPGGPTAGNLRYLAIEMASLLCIALPVGWAVQVVAVASGLWRPGGPWPEQAADFDDGRAVGPGVAPDRRPPT